MLFLLLRLPVVTVVNVVVVLLGRLLLSWLSVLHGCLFVVIGFDCFLIDLLFFVAGCWMLHFWVSLN